MEADQPRRDIYHISSKVWRKIEFAIRTGYTVLLTLILIQFVEWSPVTLYLSPVISILSAALFLGMWQASFYKTACGTIFGALLGIAIQFTDVYPPLQIVLFFFGLFWISKVPGWDRLPIVMASLSLILASLYRQLTNGQVQGLLAFRSVIALNLVPYLVTGFSLLFPKPGLAMYSARSQVLVICRKLSLMTKSVVKAFSSSDYLDVHTAEFEQWLSEIRGDVALLRQFQGHVDYEKMIFFTAIDFSAALLLFCDVAELLITELVGIQDMVKAITFNHTQSQFAAEMSTSLSEIVDETEIVFTIMGEFFEQFDPCPVFLRYILAPFRFLWQVLTCRGLMWGSKRGKVKTFYEIPASHQLIEMHTRIKHSDVKASQSSPSPGSGSGSGRMMQRERSMTAQHGFHHYHVTGQDIEAVGATPVDTSNAERKVDVKDLHVEDDKPSKPVAAKGTTSTTKDTSTPQQKHTLEQLIAQFEQSISRLCKARAVLLFAFNEVRRKYIFAVQTRSLDQAPSLTTPLTVVNKEIEVESQLILDIFDMEHHGLTSDDDDDNFDLLDSEESANEMNPLLQQQREEYIKLTVKEENIRLSLRNLGPRAAYVHRMSVLVEYIAGLNIIFHEKGKAFSLLGFLRSLVKFVWEYAVSVAVYWRQVMMFWYHMLDCCRTQNNKSKQAEHHEFDDEEEHNYASATAAAKPSKGEVFKSAWKQFLDDNGQAIKIVSGVTIAYSVVIYQLLNVFYNRGLWTVLVIALVRQDNTSSSFLMGYQRLEGTVIGAIYAILIFRIFSCASTTCGAQVQIPTLVIWITICSFFREGPQHGYAAIVAAFTPIVLLLGTTGSTEAAWGRILETFLGVAIYLAIDNFILPKRTYPVIKALVLKGIEETRIMFSESVNAVEVLVGVESIMPMMPGSSSSNNDEQREGQVRATLQEQHQQPSTTAFQTGLYGTSTDVRLRSASLLSAISSEVNLNTHEHAQTWRQDDPVAMKEALHKCRVFLDDAEQQLKLMKQQILQQQNLLATVVFEPELFHRPFPLTAYNRLLAAFIKVYRSGEALNTGSRAFSVVLAQMLRKKENVSQYLHHFTYMSKHLFLISNKADIALKETYNALSKLYNERDFHVELTSILTLRRICDKLLYNVNKHFQTKYLKQPLEVLSHFNPYFVVAWQVIICNVLCDWVWFHSCFM